MTILFITLFLIAAVCTCYIYFSQSTLRVLMYHKVDQERKDRLTVTVQQLEQQIAWLKKNRYRIISFKELKEYENAGKKIKEKLAILSFDDAYENNLQYAVPVVQEQQTKATIFIATSYIGKTNEWDQGIEKIMTAAQLQQLPSTHIELGLHTHTHASFKNAAPDIIENEMQQSIAALQQLNIPFVPVFAYAYGAFTKEKNAKETMFGIFASLGIWYAVRIGNRLNALPLRNKYLVQRIDIRGTDSFFRFKCKMIAGRLPF